MHTASVVIHYCSYGTEHPEEEAHGSTGILISVTLSNSTTKTVSNNLNLTTGVYGQGNHH